LDNPRGDEDQDSDPHRGPIFPGWVGAIRQVGHRSLLFLRSTSLPKHNVSRNGDFRFDLAQNGPKQQELFVGWLQRRAGPWPATRSSSQVAERRQEAVVLILIL